MKHRKFSKYSQYTTFIAPWFQFKLKLITMKTIVTFAFAKAKVVIMEARGGKIYLFLFNKCKEIKRTFFFTKSSNKYEYN